MHRLGKPDTATLPCALDAALRAVGRCQTLRTRPARSPASQTSHQAVDFAEILPDEIRPARRTTTDTINRGRFLLGAEADRYRYPDTISLTSHETVDCGRSCLFRAPARSPAVQIPGVNGNGSGGSDHDTTTPFPSTSGRAPRPPTDPKPRPPTPNPPGRHRCGSRREILDPRPCPVVRCHRRGLSSGEGAVTRRGALQARARAVQLGSGAGSATASDRLLRPCGQPGSEAGKHLSLRPPAWSVRTVPSIRGTISHTRVSQLE